MLPRAIAGGATAGCGFGATAGFFAAFFTAAAGFPCVLVLALLALALSALAVAFAGDFFAPFLAAFRSPFLAAFPAFFAAFFAVFFAAFRAFLTTRFFAAPAGRLAAFLVFFFFEDFLATAKILLVGSNEWSEWVTGTLTASLPQASRTPRKPAVSVQDYSLGCRARRGRSFPTP